MRFFAVFSILAVSSAAGHTFLATQPTDAMEIATDFVRLITSALEQSDFERLAGYLHENFHFKGCTLDMNKKQVVGMLAKIPKGTKFSFTLVSARFIREDYIEYKVKVAGFPMEFEAVFALRNTNELMLGYVPYCPKSFSKRPSATTIANTVLYLLTDYVADRDLKKIEEMMTSDFRFVGCKGEYSQDKALKLVADIPDDVNPTFELESARFVEENDIVYEVAIKGIAAYPIKAKFWLQPSPVEYKIRGFRNLDCSH